MSHEARVQLKEKRQLLLIQNMTDLFLAKFSSQFVFPALGHEDFHSRKELGIVWSRWLPSESMNTFEKGLLIKILLLINAYYTIYIMLLMTFN